MSALRVNRKRVVSRRVQSGKALAAQRRRISSASAQRPFPYYSLTKAQQEEIAPLQAAIGRLVDESIARWVLGEVEITDASFAQFGQDLNDAGLPAFMAFWQKILDGGNSK